MKKEKWSEDIDSIGFTVGHCNKSTIQGCGVGVMNLLISLSGHENGVSSKLDF